MTCTYDRHVPQHIPTMMTFPGELDVPRAGVGRSSLPFPASSACTATPSFLGLPLGLGLSRLSSSSANSSALRTFIGLPGLFCTAAKGKGGCLARMMLTLHILQQRHTFTLLVCHTFGAASPSSPSKGRFRLARPGSSGQAGCPWAGSSPALRESAGAYMTPFKL